MGFDLPFEVIIKEKKRSSLGPIEGIPQSNPKKRFAAEFQ
jgi:hypothetical protein